MATNNSRSASFINDDIDSEIRKIVKEIGFQDTSNFIEKHLEGIRNLLQKPQYKESYPNIRPFFENQKGFDALKDVLLFEKNRVLGKITQENINVSRAMGVLIGMFIDNNSEALEVQKNITDIDQSIKLKKGQSEESEAKFKERLKKESKANPVIRLLGFLFKKVINKVFEEIKNEQLGKPKEELDSLKGQFHKIIDSFNKELNSLMGAYGKGIKSTTAEVSPYAVTDVTSSRFNQMEANPTYLSMDKNIKPHYMLLQNHIKEKSEYVAPDPIDINSQPQSDKKAKKSVTFSDSVEVYGDFDYAKQKIKHKTLDSTPQYLQIHDLPKPQRAQISEKPKVAPKPSKEVIERALSKAVISTNQKKVAPPVPPRGESSFKKVEELRNKFDVRRDGIQPANSVKDMAKMFEAKAQEEKTLVQNIIKQTRVREEIKSSGLGSVQESTKRLDISKPKKLNISQEFKEKLKKITTPSPSSSPTSSKKPSAIQNEAPKVQKTEQSVFYDTVNNGVPTPPPMPTEDDLKKVKLIFSSEVDYSAQINSKKSTARKRDSAELKGNLTQALNESPIFRERKASIEENKPQTKFTNPNIEHVKNTPAIGG